MPLHLPIAKPCHENWDAMDARERGRFCHSCAKDVHDLATMTEAEAHAILGEHAGERICVRYRVDAEGRIRFKPEAAARVALAGLALAACTPHENPSAANLRVQPAIEHVTPRVDRPAPIIAPVVDTDVLMGDVPAPERHVKGEIAAVLPPPTHFVKGDVAVPNEPCDAVSPAPAVAR